MPVITLHQLLLPPRYACATLGKLLLLPRYACATLGKLLLPPLPLPAQTGESAQVAEILQHLRERFSRTIEVK